MPTKFNIIRISIFAAVIAWSLIVMGLAAHLNYLLIANDLTRFIPLAIFVAVCTFVIIPTLLVFGWIQRQFLIQQVRLELAFVGFLGLLWFIVGIYMTTAADSEVECDFDEDGIFAESDEFSTETFAAQYRTIEAFAIFNAILLLAYFFLLLILSVRQHRLGNTAVWSSPVTLFPWFGASPVPPKGAQMSQGLPHPVTSKVKVFAQSWLPSSSKGGSGKGDDNDKSGGAAGADAPMKAGGHYIIYIPPPSGGAAGGATGGRR